MGNKMPEYIEREAAIKEFSNNGSVFVYGKQQCKAIVSRINTIPAADVRPVVLCRDCSWWTKQKASLQGRCALLGISPTGAWFCANGQKKAKGDPHVCGKCGRSSVIVCLVDGVPYCERCLSFALGVEPTEEGET